MAKKFNLGDYIEQTESKLDMMPRLTAVELHLIDPSPGNFYSMPGLEALADNIATVGLLEPLRVREKDGRYVVVSGHRRRAALRILIERGEMDPHDKIPVFLDDEPDPGDAQDKDAARITLRQLRLIYANSDNRQYSSADKTREVQELTTIFSELKRLGYQFPGKLREHVAAAAHVSESRAARLAVIGKNLTAPKLREAYEAGRLGENAAYEIARRSPAVIGRVDELPMASVCSMTIDRLGAVLESLEKQVQDEAAEAKAYNDGVKAMQPETPVRPTLDAEAYLAQRAEEDDAYFEMLSAEADYFLRRLGAVNTRQDGIQRLKDELGRTHAGRLAGWVDVMCSPKGVRLSDINRKRGGEDITRTWTDVYDMLCTIALNRTAIDIDAERGARRDVSRMDTAEPEWQTGDPPRIGRYFCKVDMGDSKPHENRCWWGDDGWSCYGANLKANGWKVVGWWPLPKEG